MKHYLLLFLGVGIFHFSFAQSSEPPKNPLLHITETSSPIIIDGVLDEAAWEKAETTGGFWNKWPTDTEPAEAKTEVKMTYDQNFVYIAAICYDTREYIIQSLKRDQDFFNSDGFAVVIDPVYRKANGFFFGVNALGAQSEGLLTNAMEGFSMDWDNKWFSAVVNHDDRYVIEIAIPFKTLRYESGVSNWGFNFLRNDIKRNYYSTWSYVPVNFPAVDLGYLGTVAWDKAPAKVKGNVSLIPYATGGVSRDYENEINPNLNGNAGLDAKVAVSSSLNLDLTINPDFSQVDVDSQITNLERFNPFFPERRTFFLENSDIFAGFGIPPTRPFFSRRIGLTFSGEPVPIYFGARLSGNMTEKLRIGLMSVQTGATDEEQGQNYSVAAFQQRIFKRSSITGILANRQAFDNPTSPEKDDFGRNGGIELNFISNDGQWAAWGQAHTSVGPEKNGDRNYFNAGYMVNTRNITHITSYNYTGTNFDVDMGFNARQFNYDAERDTVIKLGYQILFNTFDYRFYPKKVKAINQHGISLESAATYNTDFTLNDWSLTSRYAFRFQNRSSASLSLVRSEVNLPFPTSLLGEEFEPLPTDNYVYYSFLANYASDPRKTFSLGAWFGYGDFYNGNKTSYILQLKFRKQPWGNFAMNFVRDVVKLPDPYGEADFFSIGPKIEINFTRNLFWTTFIQYNTQQDNFNINSRIQWRFKPM
ncbi:MAG: DUF5916 domain-containing protein, partial [Bacteroidia bacterium]